MREHNVDYCGSTIHSKVRPFIKKQIALASATYYKSKKQKTIALYKDIDHIFTCHQ
jgi:hypothetical protein